MISVLTCPRPTGVSYLEPLLYVINKVCPNETKVLICDGPKLDVPDWHILQAPPFYQRRGMDNKFPGWMAFEYANQIGQDLLFLEDDVRPVNDQFLLEAVHYQVPSNVSYSSLHKSKLTTTGIQPSARFMMSQAVKIPFRSLPWLLRWPVHSSGDWEAITGVDLAIAMAGNCNGWLYEQTELNYFDHIGTISAARPGMPGLH
jgi:hypothetical protein